MASDQVEVFDNTIENNQTAGLSIVSYLIADKPIKDDKYDPFCESIHIHDNRFKTNGEKPAGAIGTMVSKVVGSPLPDILYDGMVNPEKLSGGSLAPELGIHIRNNGDADFANFDLASLAARGRQAAEGRPRPQALWRRIARPGTGLDQGSEMIVQHAAAQPRPCSAVSSGRLLRLWLTALRSPWKTVPQEPRGEALAVRPLPGERLDAGAGGRRHPL